MTHQHANWFKKINLNRIILFKAFISMKNIIFSYYFAYLTHKCLSVASSTAFKSDVWLSVVHNLSYSVTKSCLNVYEMLKVNKYLFKVRGTVNKVGFSIFWYRLKSALIVYLVLLKTHHTHLEQIHKSKLILYKTDFVLRNFGHLMLKKNFL